MAGRGAGLTRAQADEELIADFSGEQFMDPEFWKALAKEEPTLFQRVSEKIKSILDRVLGVFKNLFLPTQHLILSFYHKYT